MVELTYAGFFNTNATIKRVPTKNLLVPELEAHLLVNYLAPAVLTMKLISLMKNNNSA